MTGFDTDAFAAAVTDGARSPEALLAFFTEDVDWTEIDHVTTPSAPARRHGHGEVLPMLRGVAEREIESALADAFIDDERGALVIECRYPDGRLVREHALVWFRGGRIARWHGVQAWDEPPTPFAATVFGDIAATMTTVLAVLGDRLGLFRSLARDGAASSSELAARASVSERYAREWLRGMTAAGYLERAGERFVLPRSHVDVLAAEAGPSFVAGAYEALGGELAMLDHITRAFRSGAGVALADYPSATFDGQRRVSLPWYRHELVQEWIPAAGLHQRLAAGAHVADVGCGAGEALIALAAAYPRSTFVGYDSFPTVIEHARAAAEAAQVGDRVRFESLDAAAGLPDTYDVITAFDVLHDSSDPEALLRTIARALRPGGTHLLLELNCADDPAENVGPLAALLYGISLLYCLPTSLHSGSPGLGACGCPPERVHELCAQAGFTRIEHVAIKNPMNLLYAMS
ncbi:methyltransferase [Solirubrobacter soli]|uniref:methyltransferase n=1 Tax=Solirubrobacter soli TaxID=363832 RepID=UPI00069EEF39|nr:methyltransferase [Solirubrobacter soli]